MEYDSTIEHAKHRILYAMKVDDANDVPLAFYECRQTLVDLVWFPTTNQDPFVTQLRILVLAVQLVCQSQNDSDIVHLRFFHIHVNDHGW